MAKKKKREAPTKQCPKCKKMVHTRSVNCPSAGCSHKFTSKKRKGSTPKKEVFATPTNSTSDVGKMLRQERARLLKQVDLINKLLE